MGILLENDWYLDRINGSHHIFKKDAALRPVAVPFHGKKDIGVLAKVILKEAGIKQE